MGGICERGTEINRRRKRKKKLATLKRRLAAATPSAKEAIAAKIRRMTPGAEVIIASWGLNEK